MTKQFSTVVALTFSLSSTPDGPLAALWDALDTARGRFVGDWLKTRVSGWRWSTEITHGASWHPHSPFLVFGNELDVRQLEAQAVDRWIGIVADMGLYAERNSQHVERITRTRGKALRYAHKGLSEGPAGSITPSTLLDRAAAGDAAAAALWIELDAAAQGRRFQGTGGSLRRSGRAHEDVPLDLDSLIADGTVARWLD
jgi:sugar/nucleoside kinase (ribokinase family)